MSYESSYNKAIAILAKAIVKDLKAEQKEIWDETPVDEREYDSFKELWEGEGEDIVETVLWELQDEITNDLREAIEL